MGLCIPDTLRRDVLRSPVTPRAAKRVLSARYAAGGAVVLRRTTALFPIAAVAAGRLAVYHYLM